MASRQTRRARALANGIGYAIERMEDRILLSVSEGSPIWDSPRLKASKVPLVNAPSRTPITARSDTQTNQLIQPTSGSAPTQSISKTIDQLISFVHNVWNIYDLSDTAITDTLQLKAPNPDVAFSDWAGVFIDSAYVLSPLLGGDYSTAASHALDESQDAVKDLFANVTGFSGVYAWVQLASWPVTSGLSNIYSSVQDALFNRECQLYFAIRDANHSAQEVKNAGALDSWEVDSSIGQGIVYRTENGWLSSSFGDLLTLKGDLTPPKFYDLAEQLYQFHSQENALDADSVVVRGEFLKAARPGSPEITAQPQNQSINAGESATFSVLATGSGTLRYQWMRDDIDLLGETASNLIATDAGRYSVRVINDVFSVTSESATLIVNSGPPKILSQPSDASARAGWTATFSVDASGLGPLHYQWCKNNEDIPGANNQTYVTPAVTQSDDGNLYAVRISNALGTTVSTAGTLVIASPLALTWTGANSNSWYNPLNWSGGGVPAPGDHVIVSGGAVDVPIGVSLALFDLNGGTLSGSPTVTGTMNWTGGTLGGNLTVAPGSVLNIAGAVDKFVQWGFYGAGIANAGTINWSGGNILGLLGGDALRDVGIDNRAGGTFNIQTDATIGPAPVGATYLRFTIANAGLIRKTGPAGINDLTGLYSFVNTGNLEVQSGTLFVNGGGFSGNGTLSVVLGGNNGALSGRLLFRGPAPVDQSISVLRDASFVPIPYGTVFTLIGFDTRFGMFHGIDGTDLGDSSSLVPLYDDKALNFTTAISGDANRDRSVDFNDLVKLAQNYNTTGGKTWSQGDFTGDGNVDFNDLVKLAQNYNTSLAGAGGAEAGVGIQEAWGAALAAGGLVSGPLKPRPPVVVRPGLGVAVKPKPLVVGKPADVILARPKPLVVAKSSASIAASKPVAVQKLDSAAAVRPAAPAGLFGVTLIKRSRSVAELLA